MSSPALPISIRQLVKRYGDTYALDHVDLEIRSGEFLTLLGPSGSGKTTLLTVLAGFTRPDSGGLKFGDTDVTCTPPHRRDVGMVFQNYALFPHMNVANNVGFPLRLRGVAKAEMARRVEQALEMVRLGGFGSRGIDQLSGGQRQRVALARAMVFEPRIMLMDEPLSALDKNLREQMQIELRQLHDKLGMTTVYVTHDQREALTMSDRIAVINAGRIMQLDSPRVIYERPANHFVAGFIGESAFVKVDVRQGVASFRGTPLKLASSAAADGASLLMLRPERLIALQSPTSRPDLNVFEARLVASVYQGDSLLLQADLLDGTLVGARSTAGGEGYSQPAPGESIWLGLAPEHTILVAPTASPA